MKKKNIRDTIFVVGVGSAIIAVGLFTDYTLSFARITVPQWLTVIIGSAIVIGWFVIGLFPDKYDEDGNPLKKD